MINAHQNTFQNGSVVLFKSCLNIFISSQESHKRAQKEKVESLDEDQLFIAELARDLQRVCQVKAWECDRSASGWEPSTNKFKTRSLSCVLLLQRSAVLEYIWKQDDIWPTPLCRTFIWQWASVLESKEVHDICVLLLSFSPLLTKVCVFPKKRPLQTDGWPEMDELKQAGLTKEQDVQQAKSVIFNWIRDLRAQPEVADVI